MIHKGYSFPREKDRRHATIILEHTIQGRGKSHQTVGHKACDAGLAGALDHASPARSACSRVSGSGNSAIEFRAIAGQAPGTEASKSSFSQPRRRTAHEENRGRSKTGVSLLNLAVVRHDVHDIL
jgi:hypothetical protein